MIQIRKGGDNDAESRKETASYEKKKKRMSTNQCMGRNPHHRIYSYTVLHVCQMYMKF